MQVMMIMMWLAMLSSALAAVLECAANGLRRVARMLPMRLHTCDKCGRRDHRTHWRYGKRVCSACSRVLAEWVPDCHVDGHLELGRRLQRDLSGVHTGRQTIQGLLEDGCYSEQMDEGHAFRLVQAARCFLEHAQQHAASSDLELMRIAEAILAAHSRVLTAHAAQEQEWLQERRARTNTVQREIFQQMIEGQWRYKDC